MAPIFLNLAGEIRDIIYKHYVAVDGGFVFDQESGKLKSGTGTVHRHMFALQRTCKLVATEMRGLALARNVIAFWPISNRSQDAYCLKECLRHYFWDVVDMLGFVKFTDEDKAILESLRDAVTQRYPFFLPLLDMLILQEGGYSERDKWIEEPPLWSGKAPSLLAEFKHHLMTSLPDLSGREASVSGTVFQGLNGYRFELGLDKPWIVPSQDKFIRLIAVFKGYNDDITDESFIAPPGTTYYLSATTAAIGFLNAYPEARIDIRRIVIHEDRPAVADASCHGKGLIPFCLENPELQIERRLHLWTNTFLHLARERVASGIYCESYRNRELAYWLFEALALPQSISLVLDGNPALEACSRIFQESTIVDAIWQAAEEESMLRGILVSSETEEWRQGLPCYGGNLLVYRGFTQVIRDIIRGSSPIRCNFETGEFRDSAIENLIWESRGFSTHGWVDMKELSTEIYRTVPPMPDWNTLMKQHFGIVRSTTYGDDWRAVIHLE